MGKSKKRREKAKRLAALEKLKEAGLVQHASPSEKVAASPDPSSDKLSLSEPKKKHDIEMNGQQRQPQQQQKKEGLVQPSEELLQKRKRKRLEFVLPRGNGKTEEYTFHKQGKQLLPDESLPTSNDGKETDNDEMRTAAEARVELKSKSIDDILFGSKKAKKLKSSSRGKGDVRSPKAANKNKIAKTPESSNIESHPTKEPQKKDQQHATYENKQERKPEKQDDEMQMNDEKPVTPRKKSKTADQKVHIRPANNSNGKANDRHVETPNKTTPEKSERKQNQHQSHDKENNSDKPSESIKQKKKNGKKREAAQTMASISPFESQLSGRSVEDAVRDKVGLRPRANSTDGELNLPQRGLCDERMVLAAHVWKVDENFAHQSTPKGFHNLGNTCFLNSTLQCLAYLPPFCQSLVTLSESKLAGINGKLSQGQRVTKNLCRLFQHVHGFNGNSAMKSAIAPEAIVKSLPSLGSCGSRSGYKFRPGRQEDAHEFLIHLLDAMHDGELRGAGIDQHKSGWRDRLPAPRLDETTFVHRIFGGYLRSQVQCTSCGYRSNTYDPFLDLSLEVSKKSSSSLSRAYAEFTRKETLDSENRWKCSGCKKRVCASKQLTVFRPPLTLCVQLKRFSFGGGGGFGVSSFAFGGGGSWKYGKNGKNGFKSRGGGGKISKAVEFPAEMDLSLSDARVCPYALTGIVIHVGGSASSGHYTAYVKKPGQKGKNQWYHADDSFVEPVSEKHVLKQKDAYLLFYSRKEVKIEFPAPPPRGSMSAEEARRVGKARARARANSLTSEASETKESKNTDSSSSSADEKAEDLKPIPTKPKNVAPGDFMETLRKIKSMGKHEVKMGNALIQHEVKPIAKSKKPEPQVTADSGSGSGSATSSSSSSDDESDSREEAKSPAAVKPKVTTPAADDTGVVKKTVTPKSANNHKDTQSKPNATSVEGTEAPTGGAKTTIVMTSGASREKVKVMMGPRKAKKAWKAKSSSHNQKGNGYELLGTLGVSKWNDDAADEATETATAAASKTAQHPGQRQKIVKKLENEERSRKRKMHLNRWDSALDHGKQKKVKEPSFDSVFDVASKAPKGNAFQRIQQGVQAISKKSKLGKDFVRRKNKSNHKMRR